MFDKISSMALSGFLFVALVVFGTGQASGDEAKAENKPAHLGGRIQLLGAGESLDNHDWKDDQRLFLFLKQARLKVDGTYNNCDYVFQVMLGGEEVPKSRSSTVLNTVMSLLDAYVDVPLAKDAFQLKIGQFKVPYGRERLLDSGALFNTDRSIQNNFFNIGHDVGVAAHSQNELFAGALGVFTGGGMDVPQRYIPEKLGVPMVVGRFGVNSGLDKDVFNPYQNNDGKNDSVKYAAFLNGAYTKDSRVGHSTPFNVKAYDSSIMINPNWNPYVGAADAMAKFYQVGADAAVQVPVSKDMALLLSVEGNYANFENDAGEIKASGGVAGINLLLKDWEFGVRYSVVEPDADMAYTKKTEATATTPASTKLYPITDKTISEITPSVVYYARQYGLKIIADLSLQMDTPVSIEKNHGVYNLMLQPDSTSSIATGGKELQDVYVAKLILQYDF